MNEPTISSHGIGGDALAHCGPNPILTKQVLAAVTHALVWLLLTVGTAVQAGGGENAYDVVVVNMPENPAGQVVSGIVSKKVVTYTQRQVLNLISIYDLQRAFSTLII